jgi:hypothetical protein
MFGLGVEYILISFPSIDVGCDNDKTGKLQNQKVLLCQLRSDLKARMTHSNNDIQQNPQTPVLDSTQFIHLFLCQIMESRVPAHNSRKRDIRNLLLLLCHSRIDRTPTRNRICSRHRHCSRYSHGSFWEKSVDKHSQELERGWETPKSRHFGIGSLRDRRADRVCSGENCRGGSGLSTGHYMSAKIKSWRIGLLF